METERTTRRPLRLWPGVAALILLFGTRFGLPEIAPELAMYGALGGLAGGLLVLVWWLGFSRASAVERMLGAGLWVAAFVVASIAADTSVATAGRGMMLVVYAIPGFALALVAWAFARDRFGWGRGALVASMLLAALPWTLVRFDGVSGTSDGAFAWRWSPTAEELLLAREAESPETFAAGAPAQAEPAGESPDAAQAEPRWSGFRGAERDGAVRGTELALDWSASAPRELWRRDVGPGWSSFAVLGDRLYTQEQRGDDEIVACYSVSTGEPLWRHADETRFWEALGGAGPRATPTVAGGRVYAFGANGILNALDARTGERLWSRDVAEDTEKPVPYWGFSSSPLVLGDQVVVAAEGQLVSFDVTTGERRWLGPDGGQGYSSPHRFEIDGTDHLVLMSQAGATAVALDGSHLWTYDWPGGTRIVQPAMAPDGDLLMSRGDTTALRRVGIDLADGQATFEERWETTRLKPYFSDFVLHAGHAYGTDGGLLTCVDLERGRRQWKGGRYGSGQILLIADQDALLVISEEGELALVAATPDDFVEHARHAVFDSKTWNHPVLVDDVLLLRNAEEMVALALPRDGEKRVP